MKTLVLSAIMLGLLSLGHSVHAVSDNTIVYSFMSNVGPLNPHLYSPNQMFAQEMVYEGLVDLQEDGTIRPALAERWEISDDGLQYRFYLRGNVRFSDGEPLNAAAVVKNFNAVMGNAARHAWLPLTGKIKNFRTEGELVFILELTEPYYPTVNDLALPRPFRFLSPAAFPDSGETWKGIKKAVGTGPWVLRESVLGEYDLFERNELYWGEKAKEAAVLVRVLPDPLSRAVALETGEIDLIYGIGQISYDAFNAFRHNPAYATSISHPVGGMALAVHSGAFPTNEKAVRQALQYATNKDALVTGVLLDTQQRADTLFAPDVPYCNVGLNSYPFDPEQAASILEQAGWTLPDGKRIREKDGAQLAIDFCFVGNDAAQKAIAEVLQAQYAEVGVLLRLLGEEEDSFFKRQKDGSFGMIINTTWGPPFEPHAMVGSMLLPSHADYMAQSGLPMKADLDRRIRRVLETTDMIERQALYTSILTTLHDEAVYVPLFYFSLLAVHKKDRLKDVRFAPGKTKIPFEWFIKTQ